MNATLAITAGKIEANRHGLRAPRGGCTVAGKVFKGGQFCLPYDVADPHGDAAKPAPLAGSSRQVLWASRLRREELARLDGDLAIRREMLASPVADDRDGIRAGIRRDLAARRQLTAETSAASIIERHRTWSSPYSEPVPARA